MSEEQLIKTSDLYFAAFLQCIGCKIIATEKEGKNKNVFTFDNKENRENLREAYINEDLTSNVPALKYANNIRSLKTYCYIKTDVRQKT